MLLCPQIVVFVCVNKEEPFTRAEVSGLPFFSHSLTHSLTHLLSLSLSPVVSGLY